MGKTPLGLASRGSFIDIVDMIIKADRLLFNNAPVEQLQCGDMHHCFYSATCNALIANRPSSVRADLCHVRMAKIISIHYS